MKAIDPDLGRNGMVLYELQRSNISDTHSQHLNIEAQTGQIVVGEVPLPLGKHTLFIEASDQPVNPSERRFSLAVVTVQVVESGLIFISVLTKSPIWYHFMNIKKKIG